MIEFWNPDRALVTNNPFRESIKGPEQLGWLNYRADFRFSDYLPDEVSREPFNGGILFRIGDGHPLTDNDITEVQIGTKIQQAISAQR